MVTNSLIKRVSGANCEEGAAEIQPVLLIPPQWRCEIELGIFERRVEERVGGTAGDGRDSEDSPPKQRPLHSRDLDRLSIQKVARYVLPTAKKTQFIAIPQGGFAKLCTAKCIINNRAGSFSACL